MKVSRLIWVALGCAAVAGGVYVSIPQPNVMASETCGPEVTGSGLCEIEGSPLQMSGTPVYLPPMQQAFFPISAEVRFTDSKGVEWTAPTGTLSDGASIPLILAPMVGDRQSREFLIAAALHDAYCGIGNDELETWQTRSWQDVHRMFYDALVASGTSPAKARVMFAAVFLGGPRWGEPARDLSGLSEEAIQRELRWCLKWIELSDPSVQDIEQWMTDREEDLLSGSQIEPNWDLLRAG